MDNWNLLVTLIKTYVCMPILMVMRLVCKDWKNRILLLDVCSARNLLTRGKMVTVPINRITKLLEINKKEASYFRSWYTDSMCYNDIKEYIDSNGIVPTKLTMRYVTGDFVMRKLMKEYKAIEKIDLPGHIFVRRETVQLFVKEEITTRVTFGKLDRLKYLDPELVTAIEIEAYSVSEEVAKKFIHELYKFENCTRISIYCYSDVEEDEKDRYLIDFRRFPKLKKLRLSDEYINSYPDSTFIPKHISLDIPSYSDGLNKALPGHTIKLHSYKKKGSMYFGDAISVCVHGVRVLEHLAGFPKMRELTLVSHEPYFRKRDYKVVELETLTLVIKWKEGQLNRRRYAKTLANSLRCILSYFRITHLILRAKFTSPITMPGGIPYVSSTVPMEYYRIRRKDTPPILYNAISYK